MSLGAFLLPAAAAQADAVWTGASSSSSWSNSANWSGGTLPTSSTGTLSFPLLGSCGTCYAGQNDLNGIGVTSLVFGNSSNLYQIGGNSITVGSGGVSDSPGGGSVLIGAPLVLSGSQSWVVGSQVNGYDSLTLHGGVTGGAGDALSLSMPNGDLFVDSDMEVGPVSSSGPGGLHIGGPPGSGHPGSVNGSDGQSVSVTGGSLVANPGSTTGPLSVAGSSLLLLGTNPHNNGATTLAVQGAASLGSSTTMRTFIDNNGSTPGTDFSQLSATGNLTVAGKLVLGQGLSNNNNTGSCVALSTGDVATLLTTPGTLSGTFANAPDGATLTMTSAYSCETPAPTLQINYTAHSVTATVVSGATTSTATTTSLAAPNPSPAVTNQPVTLTATVTTSGSGTTAPSGTVAFSENSGTIPGCGQQPLSGSGSSATATCTTTFTAAGSPETLTAAFTPATGSGQTASDSTNAPQTLTINPAATSTALAASNTSPTTGTNVTYTATVTPATTGPATPSGTVTFLDGSTPITGCSAQPLTNGATPTATCTVAYTTTTTHTITANYTGDPNFTGSTSPTTTITPQPPTTTTFPTTTVLDTFPQSGALGSNWKSPALQDSGTISVSVGTPGETVSSGGSASALWSTAPFNADQEAYLTVPVLPAAGHALQIDTRVSSLTPSTVSMYFLQITPSKQLWDLRRKLSGAGSTSMKTFTAPFAAGDSAGLQLIGSTITAWHESGTGSWTTVGSVTDTSITAGGYIGFTLGDTTARGGAFGGGNASSSSGQSAAAILGTTTASGGTTTTSATTTTSKSSATTGPLARGGLSSTRVIGSNAAPRRNLRRAGRLRAALSFAVGQSHTRWREPRPGVPARAAAGAQPGPLGTRFAIRLSSAARVTITISQILPGARGGRRTARRGSLSFSAAAGVHRLRFAGRLHGVDLPPGTYSGLASAVGRSGARARAHALHFTILG